jgi:hypothetical protein
MLLTYPLMVAIQEITHASDARRATASPGICVATIQTGYFS